LSCSGLTPGFTSAYRVYSLVYFEETSDVDEALRREKQLKWWLREWKLALIESFNPEWKDLAEEIT
jgi:putative endonuclease